MQHVLETGKRVLSVAVAAATIMLSAGASLLTPSVADAASAGDLIKGTSLSTVYYYGHDGYRYTFPNEKTFMTWFEDFDGVVTISDSALAAISLAGNVVYRPGSHWIKIQSDPKTYAVSTDGSIHWIESEDVAVDFAGSNWASQIHDVSDVFFTDYSVGTSLMEATAFEGMLYMDGSDYFIVWGGEKRELSSAGRSANNLQGEFFLNGSGIDDTSLSSGDEITSEVASLVDPAQTVEDDGSSEATGDLEISLSSSTASGATVPQGANGVEVMSFDIEAGADDASVDSIALTMTAVGATTDITSVYLYEGNDRLSDARSVNASTRMVTFSNLNLEVESGEMRTLTVRIELSSSATAGDTIAFSVASADDITASGDVDGDFPVEGEEFTVSGVDVGEIDVHESGTITNPILGADDAEIGEFKLTANTEAAYVELITLKIDNASDHSDFWLWDSTVPLVEGEYIGNKLVRFDLSADPFYIEEGGNNIFSVSADVGGDAGDDVKVYVENKVDVVAIGGDYGFGMTVDIDDSNGYDGTSCTSTSGKCSFSDVAGGDITFAFTGPSAGDISTNSQDQTLFTMTLTAQNDITVKDLDMIVYADDDGDADATDAVDDSAGNADGDADGLVNTGTEANIKDIKIINVDTGAVVMGPLELDALTDASSADDADQTIDFTEDWSMEAGEVLHLALTADVDDGLTSGTELAAALAISGFQAEDSNADTICTSGCTSTNVIPTSNLTGYNQEASSASVTFRLASSSVSTTVVQGKQDVEVIGVSVAAGDASDLTFTSLVFSGYGDESNATGMTEGGASGYQFEDYVSSCLLYAGDEVISDTETPTTGGTVTFNNMDYVLTAGSTELLTIVCDLANPSDTDDDVIAFELEAYTDVTVEDEAGNQLGSSQITLTAAGSGDEGINDTDTDNAVYTMSSAVTITQSGSIAVAASANTPSAAIVLTGSDDNFMGAFTFTATNESFTVDKLEIEEVAAGEFGTTAATDYANNVEMVTITYPKADGTTGTKSAVMSGAQALFSGLEFFVDVEDPSDVNVYVDVPASSRNSGGAATSGERIEVAISSDSGDFNAVGVDSGVADTQAASSDTDTDRVYIVMETKPTLSINSSSPSGAKVPGDQEVLRFNVAAGSNEDVVFDELLFKVQATDNASESTTDNQPDWQECDSDDGAGTYGAITADLDFYNLSEEGTATALDVNGDWSILVSAAATTPFTACGATQYDITYFNLDLTTKEVVPAGQTYIYSFYWDMSGASASSDDVVQITMQPDGNQWEVESNASNESDVAITDTTVTVDDGTAFSAGDVIVFDLDDGADYDTGSEESMLVTGISSNDLTVIRGYLGSTPAAADAGSGSYEYETSDDVLRAPTAFAWEDDGITGTATAGEDWGGYLIGLPVTGGSLSF